MVKQFIKDTFEKVAEEGRELTVGTAKKAVEQLIGAEKLQNSKTPESILNNEINAKKNYTEIDKGALGETYKKQDEASMEAIKMRLFQNVQGESQMAHQAAVRHEQERLQGFEKPAEAHPENMANMPKGKAKKNIFGGRRKAVSNMENKPAKGK